MASDGRCFPLLGDLRQARDRVVPRGDRHDENVRRSLRVRSGGVPAVPTLVAAAPLIPIRLKRPGFRLEHLVRVSTLRS